MSAADLIALALGGTVLSALGGAVAFLFRQLDRLRAESAAREGMCEARLNLSFRRQRATWNKLIEVAAGAGVPVNGPYADEMQEIDAAEATLLKGSER